MVWFSYFKVEIYGQQEAKTSLPYIDKWFIYYLKANNI